MKKSLFIAALLAVPLTSVAFAQGPRGGGPPMGGGGFMGGGRGQALVTGSPYSAVSVIQNQEILGDGNRITNSHSTAIARDGQGRVRTEETVKPRGTSTKPAYTVTTILDYVGGNRYMLDSSTMTAYQSPLHTPRAGGGPKPAAPVAGSKTLSNGATLTTTLLPAQHVNGVLATGTQITETIPAGSIGNAQPIQVTRVTWVSNDLKVPVQIKSSDPRFGTTVMDLTNIVQAEPSGSLFIVPAGYTVKSSGGRGGDGGQGGSGMGSRMRGPHGPPPQ